MTRPAAAPLLVDDTVTVPEPAWRSGPPAAGGVAGVAEHPAGADPVRGLVDHLRRRHADRITGYACLPARAAQWADLPADLDPRIATALAARGITRLYRHQQQAWQAVTGGEHTVVVTPTASGKSLCYHLPALHAALTRGEKSLYLFPTKALAQDQVAEILALTAAGDLGIRAHSFDGDTPSDARAAVRVRGDIVVSNPDMLHVGVLPHHTKWAQFFESLAYVVIDEVHTYRGVFGSHLANVLRRLQRICAFYGRQPVFILTSATIGNPGEHAAQLIGAPVRTLDDSGAPAGERHVLLWNPPVVNPALGLRASARSQTTRIARAATRRGLTSIVFANTRLAVEVLTKYLKDTFDADPRHRPARIMAYRGGYLPTQRRATEARLRAGEVDCVVATSALELGVDIGALDVCILNGYPGSIAATWQRLGRAGRRTRPSLGVLVASSEALDQFIVRTPDYLLTGSPEHARIAPDQLLILLDHVRCAAFELPFRRGERFGGEDLPALLDHLAEQGVLHREHDTWHWIEDSYPANTVSLRAIANGNFVVVDITDGAATIIAEVDYSAAATTLYEGAIYLVQAEPWQVERLDWEGRKAFVRRTDADYYTDAIDYTRLTILDEFTTDEAGAVTVASGEVHLVRRVPGYKKIRYYTHENIGYGDITLPDQQMHTTAVWWRLAPAALAGCLPDRDEATRGLLGAAHAMHVVATLVTMSEPRDLGRSVGSPEGAPTGREDGTWAAAPTIHLYDNYPGGVGLAGAVYERRYEVLRGARALVRGCSCTGGCPSCTGPLGDPVAGGQLTARACAERVLDLLAGASGVGGGEVAMGGGEARG